MALPEKRGLFVENALLVTLLNILFDKGVITRDEMETYYDRHKV